MDTIEEILMPNEWDTKGCEHCRRVWRSGERLPEIAVNLEEHTSLHRCSKCGTLWEMHERFVDVISDERAKEIYPKAPVGEDK